MRKEETVEGRTSTHRCGPRLEASQGWPYFDYELCGTRWGITLIGLQEARPGQDSCPPGQCKARARWSDSAQGCAVLRVCQGKEASRECTRYYREHH